MSEVNPLVSVNCITYNHERFIRQALDSILLQKTNFPIEIIVHDDASTDDTAKIIKEYADKFPNVIYALFQNENQYSRGRKPWSNYTFPRSRGKYIALCEGDDYWIDPHKLQKQVEFMESNDDYSLCFTNCQTIELNGNIISNNFLNKQHDEMYSRSDRFVVAPTQTMLFRSKYVKPMPKSFDEAPGGDTYLVAWLLKHGKAKYHNYISAAYRITNQGAWTGKTKFQKDCHSILTYFAILNILDDDVSGKYIYSILERIEHMQQFVDTEKDQALRKSYYDQISAVIKSKRHQNRMDRISYYRLRIYAIRYYYCDNVWVKLTRKISPKFLKLLLRIK